MINFSFKVFDGDDHLIFHGCAFQTSSLFFRFECVRNGSVSLKSTQTIHDFVNFMLLMGCHVSFIPS